MSSVIPITIHLMQQTYIGPSHKLNILLQFGNFAIIDVHRAGKYQIKTRIYTKAHRSLGGVRRIDGTVIKVFDSEPVSLGPSEDAPRYRTEKAATARYIKCQNHHSDLCDWRCRQKYVNIQKPNIFWTPPIKAWSHIPIVPDSFTSNTFIVKYQEEVIPLNNGVLFEIDLGLDVSKRHVDVLYVEFSLYYSSDMYPSHNLGT